MNQVADNLPKAFCLALLLHLLILILMLFEPTNRKPNLSVSQSKQPQAQSIAAVSISETEVMQKVNQLKEERLREQQAMQRNQERLAREAKAAEDRRMLEERRVLQLKQEAEKQALLHKKQLAEEQRRLNEILKQKAIEEKLLADKRLAEKRLEEKRLEAQRQAEAQQKQQAAMEAANQVVQAKEVDRYKALIIHAISQQWILPESANPNLSSQFRIRLAPNGVVLDVNLLQSSGDPILDRSAQAAIYKASPLPVPTDPKLFSLFRDINLTVKPENARG